MKTIFVSDLHIQGLEDPTLKAFLAFLDEREGTISRLVIVGDLFDFWVGFRSVVYVHYVPVLERLWRLRQKGVVIDYVEGNHDFDLGPFFRDILKVNVIPKEASLQLDHWNIYLTHGDGINPKDRGYHILRWFLRTPFTRFLIKILPASWLWAIGKKSSHVSRHYRNVHPQTAELYRSFAQKKLEEGSSDVVILGHSHTPEEKEWEIAGKKKYYFNLGDWITHFTYLEYEGGIFRLKKFVFTGGT